MASSDSGAGAAGAAVELPSKLDETSDLYFWNRVVQEPKTSVYTLKSGGRLFGTSDFEGVSFSMLNLFDNPDDVTTNVIRSEPQSLANLMKDFIIRGPDGSIQLANPNDIFYFSGDVWGVGPRNIQLLRQLINMKNTNKNEIIVIYGNRDLNRGRWPTETDLTSESRQSLVDAMIAFNNNPTESIELLQSVVIDFKYKISEDSDESYARDLPFNYLWRWGGNTKVTPVVPAVDWGIRIASCQTAKDRVEMISESMGEKDGWRFIVDEYALMCGDNFVDALASMDDDIKYKIYLHLVYLMSSNKDTIDEIENVCHPNATDFVDIYLAQMNASNLYALVNLEATGEFALISHGVVSKTELPVEPGTIPEPETDTKKNVVVSLEGGITQIESGMIKIASEPDPNGWLSLISSLTSTSNVGVYYDRVGNNYTGEYHDVTGSFSNIKGGSGRQDKLLKDKIKLNKSNTLFNLHEVTYRVSGHTPTGYIGLVKKSSSNGKYYFCTDVSKTDKQDYGTKERYTCCFLILEPDITKTPKMTSRFIGRFAIGPTDIKTSNLVLTPSDTSKPLYVNYSINVDVFNPETPYLSLPELMYGDRDVKFSYNLEGPTKTKCVTLYDAKAAELVSDKMTSLVGPSPSPPPPDVAKLIGHGGTRRRNYRTSTKKSKKTKITKKQHYKNKRTSQKKHKKSRK
jgi:hypothetical protein